MLRWGRSARRIHRALFGQSLIDFAGDSWNCVSSQTGKTKISNRCRGKKCAMQTCILSKFSRQFTSSREAVRTTEVFPEEEEEPVQYVSSDNDSSEEDEEECDQQQVDFSGIRADERPASPVREAIAIHPVLLSSFRKLTSRRSYRSCSNVRREGSPHGVVLDAER